MKCCYKSRILVFLLVALSQPTFANPKSCERLFSKLIDSSLGHVDQYTLQDFKTELDSTSLSSWKKKLIYNLWSSSAERGYRLVDLHKNPAKATNTVRLPYYLDLPREVANSLIAVAKAKGLKPGERYVVLPLKLLAHQSVKRFFGNFFFVMSLGGTGVVLDATGLAVSDPLLDETNPNELAENEVTVILKFGSKYSDVASRGAALEMEALAALAPEKIVVIDLSKDKLTSSDSVFAPIQQLKAELEHKHKKIKKIIVSAHGSPGTIYGDRIQSMNLSELSEILRPLVGQFSLSPEVHFESCFLAGNAEGRKDINSFGESILPSGGKVIANRIAGWGLGSPHGTLSKRNPATSHLKLLSYINPTFGEIPNLALQIFGSFAARSASFRHQESLNLDSDIVFEPAKYEITVK